MFLHLRLGLRSRSRFDLGQTVATSVSEWIIEHPTRSRSAATGKSEKQANAFTRDRRWQILAIGKVASLDCRFGRSAVNLTAASVPTARKRSG